MIRHNVHLDMLAHVCPADNNQIDKIADIYVYYILNIILYGTNCFSRLRFDVLKTIFRN